MGDAGGCKYGYRLRWASLKFTIRRVVLATFYRPLVKGELAKESALTPSEMERFMTPTGKQGLFFCLCSAISKAAPVSLLKDALNKL